MSSHNIDFRLASRPICIPDTRTTHGTEMRSHSLCRCFQWSPLIDRFVYSITLPWQTPTSRNRPNIKYLTRVDVQPRTYQNGISLGAVDRWKKTERKMRDGPISNGTRAVSRHRHTRACVFKLPISRIQKFLTPPRACSSLSPTGERESAKHGTFLSLQLPGACDSEGTAHCAAYECVATSM